MAKFLDMQDSEYNEMYAEVEAALAAADLLGSPLRRLSDRGRAARAVHRIADAHPEWFGSRRGQVALMELVRRCNRNYKKVNRRRQEYNKAAHGERANQDGNLPGEFTLRMDLGTTAKTQQDGERGKGDNTACVESEKSLCSGSEEKDEKDSPHETHETQSSPVQH